MGTWTRIIYIQNTQDTPEEQILGECLLTEK